jgi:hypothetical protein
LHVKRIGVEDLVNYVYIVRVDCIQKRVSSSLTI